mmetsp:Transcript_86947/g.279006  ORF Transcript_86947/g.279006 Transcript_86947/m.279006 type:complete len:153 (+) Transcript_86947:80-538(+)
MAPVLEEPFAGLGMLPPLHQAAWKDDASAVLALLREGAEVDATTSWTTDSSYGSRFAGVTALHIAVDRGAEQVVAVLLGASADLASNMSHFEMGYHMGEGKYWDVWALARKRGGEEAIEALTVTVSQVKAASAKQTTSSCLSGVLQGICSRL